MRPKIAVATAALCLLAVASTAAAVPKLQTAAAPQGYVPADVAPPQPYGPADFLVIEDVTPWGYASNEGVLSELGFRYHVVTTLGFAFYDLQAHGTKVIVVASDQWTSSYRRLYWLRAKVADFVYAGGVLVAHACDLGWHGGRWHSYPWIPGLLKHTTSFRQLLSQVQPWHPVLAHITDPQLDYWSYSTHGYFTNLSSATSIIVGITGNPIGKPTYIEYPFGWGTVLATMQPMEWRGGLHPEARWLMLKDEMQYAWSTSMPTITIGAQRLAAPVRR